METEGDQLGAGSDRFKTTCWTNILTISSAGAVEATAAFGQFYQEYWKPIEGYIRRKSLSDDEAGELTQAFFCTLLEKKRLAAVQRDGGRFRAYLLAAAKNFLTVEWQKRAAQKRGGGVPLLPLDEELAAGAAGESATSGDALYDRDWAYLINDKSLERLKGEFARAGKLELFQALRPYLHVASEEGGAAEGMAAVGMSPGAYKVAAHRLRQRYGEILRAEIGRTLGPGEDAAAELRYLIEIVSKTGVSGAGP